MGVNLHSYERIDKGVKKGSTINQDKPRRSRAFVSMRRGEEGQVEAIPPDLNPHEVLQKYLSEQTTSQIAKSYGIKRKSLVAWLRTTVPNEWKQVQITRAFIRKDDAESDLEDGMVEGTLDPLSLACARELLKAGQWDLERLDSGNYGQKQEVTHKVDVVNLEEALAVSMNAIMQKLVHTGVMSNPTPNVINDLPEPVDVQALPGPIEPK